MSAIVVYIWFLRTYEIEAGWIIQTQLLVWLFSLNYAAIIIVLWKLNLDLLCSMKLWHVH